MEASEHTVMVDKDEYERLKRMEANLFPASEPQMLDTGKYGQILVVQTWDSAEAQFAKIHKLVNGSYVYDSGLPVDKRKALEIIPLGKERDAAFHWFDHRHDDDEVKKGRGIIVNPDETLTFEDGSPVTSIQDITQNIKSGLHQELLIRCFLKNDQGKPSEIPDWMTKKEEPPPKPKAKKPAKKKAGRPKVKFPQPLKSQPLEAGAPGE